LKYGMLYYAEYAYPCVALSKTGVRNAIVVPI